MPRESLQPRYCKESLLPRQSRGIALVGPAGIQHRHGRTMDVRDPANFKESAMRATLMAVSCGLCVLVLCTPAVAQDDVKAIVEKAIKAHGSENNLNKFKASKLKAKGTMSAMGMDLEFTIDAAQQLPDKMRNEIKLDIMG